MDNYVNKKPIVKDTISVIIRNRKGIVLEEEVKAVTSFNEKGVFDVLPEHANFISIIKDNLTIHKKGGEKKEIKINQGILKVYENEINIYLDISEYNSLDK